MWKESWSYKQNKGIETTLESEYQLFEEKLLVNIINWRYRRRIHTGTLTITNELLLTRFVFVLIRSIKKTQAEGRNVTIDYMQAWTKIIPLPSHKSVRPSVYIHTNSPGELQCTLWRQTKVYVKFLLTNNNYKWKNLSKLQAYFELCSLQYWPDLFWKVKNWSRGHLCICPRIDHKQEPNKMQQ